MERTAIQKMPILLFALMLAGLTLALCAGPAPIGAPPVAPTPRPTIPYYITYTGALPLPDSRVLPLDCYRDSWEDTCRATFPNGNIMDYATDPIDYSPDGKFAVRPCVRSTHDSSCLLGSQLWDMVNGVEVGGFAMYVVYQWVPGESHTVAYVEDQNYMHPSHQLVFLDALTGKETYPEKCPAFFLKEAESFPWVAEACHVPFPTPTPFVTTFTSPDRRFSFKVECFDGAQCWITVPNGRRIRNTIVDWSHDYQFATMCGDSQPNPCSVIQVWNMFTGELQKTLPESADYQWSPEGHALFYVQQSSPKFVIFDPETGRETFFESCPDWYRPRENKIWTQKVCK